MNFLYGFIFKVPYLATVSGVTSRTTADFHVGRSAGATCAGDGSSQNNIPNRHLLGVLVQSGTDQDALNVGQNREYIETSRHMNTGSLNIPPLAFNQRHDINVAGGVVSESLPREG